MPKALEQKLTQEAIAKGLSGKRAAAYIFGTMRKTGWAPGKHITAAARKMQQ